MRRKKVDANESHVDDVKQQALTLVEQIRKNLEELEALFIEEEERKNAC
jgi:hypothetical protein